MTNQEIADLTGQHSMNIIARAPVAFVRGEGCRVWDADGKEYLDLLAGLAVNSLGYNHPELTAAIRQQAGAILHSSNLYLIEPQARLAEALCEACFADRAFICNSGTEAAEAAIKLARKWARQRLGQPKSTIITAYNSFHGRTLGALAATGQEKLQANFAPMPAGFKYVPYNDLSALEQAIDQDTCAVMLEPIQGESGIYPAEDDYLRGARALCDERKLLLIYDEVQTGIARTGRMFCYEHSGAVPDVMFLAKGLGGGVPVGAVVATEEAAVFEPSDHGSTFGGNHLACTAALTVLEVVGEENLVEAARCRGEQLLAGLYGLQDSGLPIKEVRGKGLMLAFELAEDGAKQVHQACLKRGLLVNAIGERIVRLLPPLIVTEAECEEGLAILKDALTEVTQSSRS